MIQPISQEYLYIGYSITHRYLNRIVHLCKQGSHSLLPALCRWGTKRLSSVGWWGVREAHVSSRAPVTTGNAEQEDCRDPAGLSDASDLFKLLLAEGYLGRNKRNTSKEIYRHSRNRTCI